jgi:hypothetical protein
MLAMVCMDNAMLVAVPMDNVYYIGWLSDSAIINVECNSLHASLQDTNKGIFVREVAYTTQDIPPSVG